MTNRLLAVLPADSTTRVFLLGAFVDAAGRGLFLAGSALFYTQVIRLTTAQVGTGLSIAALCGLLCGVPIGRLADRIGAPRMLIALQVWRAIGFLAYPFLTNFTGFVLVACFIGAVETSVTPVLQSVAGSVAEGRTPVHTMAKVAVVRNTAYAIAALVATVSMTLAGTAAYIGIVLANGIAFLVSAALLTRLRIPHVTGHAGSDLSVRHLPWRDLPFLALALANGILFLHMALLSIVFPLWIVTRTSAPNFLVGVALFLNTVLVVTLQVRMSRGGDDVGHAGRIQCRAGAALAVFCVLVAASAHANPVVASALLLAATAALTVGELWQSAGGWGVSFALAPVQRRAFYLSMYNLGASGMAAIGPWVLTAAVLNQGTVGWCLLGVVFVLAGLAVPAIIHRRMRSPG